MNSPVRVFDAWGTRGEQADLALLGDGEKVDGGLHLEDAVDDLEAVDLALAHGHLALFEPADVGAEGDAEVADLALELELLEGFEQLVALQGTDAGVVDLVEVDVVGVEAAEALLAGELDELAVELLGPLAVAVAGSRVVDVVAELGGDDQVVAPVAEDAGQDLLAVAVAVGIGGVEEVDAQLHRVFQQGGALGVLQPPPPVGGDGPDAEAHLGQDQIGARQLSESHNCCFLIYLMGSMY